MKITKKDFWWNMIANVSYSFMSMFLSFIVIMIIGANDGGIFSFGFSTVMQLAYVMSYFGIRSFHITDSDKKYNFDTYFSHRVLTSIATFVILSVYVFTLFFNHIYTFSKTIFLLFMILNGINDGFFDVYECELQRENKLYIAGQGLFFRTITFAFVFVGVLSRTKNLIIAVILAFAVKTFVGIVKEEKELSKCMKYNMSLDIKSIKELTVITFPLFVTVVFDMYMHLSSKFAIDLYLTDFYNGFFNILFMPNNILVLICSFVMRPLLTPLAYMYNEDKKLYKKQTDKIIIFAIIIALLIVIIGFLCRNIYFYIVNVATKNVYIDEIFTKETSIVFLFLLIGGFFYAICTPCYYFLVIEKENKKMSIIYTVLFILSFVVANIFVKHFALVGAGIAYIIIEMLLSLSLIFCHIRKVKKIGE